MKRQLLKYRKDKNNQQSEQNTTANVHQRNDSQITDFDKTQEMTLTFYVRSNINCFQNDQFIYFLKVKMSSETKLIVCSPVSL